MLTVQRYPVPAQPVRLCAAVNSPRTVVLENDGLVPVWLGTSSVEAGAGRRFDPGDVDDYAGPDELYAAALGNPLGSVVVEETRAQ